MPELQRLFPEIRQYLEIQSSLPVELSEPHRQGVAQLARWIAGRGNRQTDVIVVCTGNSRRSILGATLGNAIAACRGHQYLRFYSAGTAPSAFNPRTIQTLREIGVVIEPTGSEAPRGRKHELNPHYLVQWGRSAASSQVEYSKALEDVSLPGREFAAILVCDEADASCPIVQGASLRVSMPFHDPKAYDGTREEEEQYGRTRDLIAQVMLRAC